MKLVPTMNNKIMFNSRMVFSPMSMKLLGVISESSLRILVSIERLSDSLMLLISLRLRTPGFMKVMLTGIISEMLG